MTAKPIPKSLHTVTVLAKVGKLMHDRNSDWTPTLAVQVAASILGYYVDDDAHSLIPRAVAILTKGARS